MKKINYFLLIAFSFIFMPSCNTEEDMKGSTDTITDPGKNPVTVFTSEEKVASLNNYEWLEEPDNINNPRCGSQDKLIFNAVSILGDVFNGNYTSYKYTDEDRNQCIEDVVSGAYKYSPATDQIRIDYNYINTLSSPVPSIVRLTITETTIKMGDKTFNKGPLRK